MFGILRILDSKMVGKERPYFQFLDFVLVWGVIFEGPRPHTKTFIFLNSINDIFLGAKKKKKDNT